MPLWTLFTALAIVSQTVRTAGQKQLSLTLDSATVTYARYFFGAPFVVAYFLWLRSGNTETLSLTWVFWLCVIIGAIAQIAATILMVQLFRRRNFAVGITYIRSEAFLTALLGVSLFGEVLSFAAWIAILTSVVGVLIMNRAKTEGSAEGLLAFLTSPSAAIGLSSGLLFALTSLLIRTAGLSLGLEDRVMSGATVLIAIVGLQTLGMTLWFAGKDRSAFAALLSRFKLGSFVGLTSALGSIGWFTAMNLERASIVKAVGQAELILALGVSAFFFKEKIRPLELVGMALMVVGIVALLLG